MIIIMMAVIVAVVIQKSSGKISINNSYLQLYSFGLLVLYRINTCSSESYIYYSRPAANMYVIFEHVFYEYIM